MSETNASTHIQTVRAGPPSWAKEKAEEQIGKDYRDYAVLGTRHFVDGWYAVLGKVTAWQRVEDA